MKTMFAGQVSWADPADVSGQRVVPEKFATGTDSETAFALVYETVLGLSAEQCSESDAPINWLETNAEGGLSPNCDSSALFASASAGSKTSDRKFVSRDAATEIALAFPGALNYGASKGQFIFKSGDARVDGVSTQGAGLQPTAMNTKVQQDGYPGSASGLDGNVAAPPNFGGGFDKSQLSIWMDAHALSRSSHHCAMYCRLGMEAAGLNTGDRPQSGDAGDYGPFLLRHGAQTVSPDSYVPQVGDVVVFNKTDQHVNGHIEMYDGQHWVSDFLQHSFSPYRDAASTPPYTIYRLG